MILGVQSQAMQPGFGTWLVWLLSGALVALGGLVVFSTAPLQPGANSAVGIDETVPMLV